MENDAMRHQHIALPVLEQHQLQNDTDKELTKLRKSIMAN
jgi:hypothetical protein